VAFAGLEVRLAAAGDVPGFNALLAAHHYLGPRGSAGLLRYVAVLHGEQVVLATFGAAVRKCRPREGVPGLGRRAAHRPARPCGVQPAEQLPRTKVT
jgi:hypothetical protein